MLTRSQIAWDRVAVWSGLGIIGLLGDYGTYRLIVSAILWMMH